MDIQEGIEGIRWSLKISRGLYRHSQLLRYVVVGRMSAYVEIVSFVYIYIRACSFSRLSTWVSFG